MNNLIFHLENFETENFDVLSIVHRDIIRSFHAQLSTNPISFTVFGFFAIDLSLLASILTGIISFQIILVQFHASENSTCQQSSMQNKTY